MIDRLDGNVGESLETAFLINSDDPISGVEEEMAYVASQFGQEDVDWVLESQTLLWHEGRPHDILKVKLTGGQIREFFFDITTFYGK